MEWWLAGLLIFGSFIVLLLAGVPVAFAFAAINIAGVLLFWGGTEGLYQLIVNIRVSVAKFTFVPVPLFILMGEVMFRSRVAPLMMNTLDKLLGRLPGRLGLLAVAGGTVFSVLSGSSMSSTAMLGSVLVPEMEKRGYKKPMTLGPILSSGVLAVMIPPTALGVILASLAMMSVAGLLIAIIVPGLIMAALFASYIVIRCWLQPSLAPPYEVTPLSLSEKLKSFMLNVVPLGSIVFLVIGVIFLGMATPSEAAALGTMGTFLLAACYKGFNWKMVKESISDTLRISGMIFLIMSGAAVFSQILAYTKVTPGIVALAEVAPLPPIALLLIMQLILLVMGCFMDIVAIMMVTIPLYMPIVDAVGFDPIWFGVVMLMNMEIASISPPFGLNLFVMKGVAPPHVTMGDIYLSSLPFCGLIIIAMGLVIAFPQLALWLPAVMR